MNDIVVRVVSIETSMVVEETVKSCGNATEAVMLAVEYQKKFEEKTFNVRIFVGSNVAETDRTELHNSAAARGIFLEQG